MTAADGPDIERVTASSRKKQASSPLPDSLLICQSTTTTRSGVNRVYFADLSSKTLSFDGVFEKAFASHFIEQVLCWVWDLTRHISAVAAFG